MLPKALHIAHFKTGRAWQPHAWKVRFLRRVVPQAVRLRTRGFAGLTGRRRNRTSADTRSPPFVVASRMVSLRWLDGYLDATISMLKALVALENGGLASEGLFA
jgi:hypothetical protein